MSYLSEICVFAWDVSADDREKIISEISQIIKDNPDLYSSPAVRIVITPEKYGVVARYEYLTCNDINISM